MSTPEPGDTFKVTDRRRRTSEDEPPALPSEPVPEPAAATSDLDDEGPSLIGLFEMLANSAAMAIGERDLDQASELLALLVLLRRKTEGHRTVEETEVLDELTGEVQRRYAEVMPRSG